MKYFGDSNPPCLASCCRFSILVDRISNFINYLNFMAISIKEITSMITSVFIVVGYAEISLQYLTYANILFQFLWIYLLKIINQTQPLNSSIASLSQSLAVALTSQFLITLANLVLSCLIIMFVLAVVFYRSKAEDEQSNSKECFNRKNISGLITKIYIVIKIIIVPCLAINLTALNYSLQNPSYTFTGAVFNFTLAIFNTLFIVAATLFYSEGMLLGSWTVFVLFLCLELGFFNIPIKLLSIVILLTMSLKKCCFERILLRLLLFIFAMDFLSYTLSITINLMQFIIFNILIVAAEFVRPQQHFFVDFFRQNQILLQNLEKLSKKKKLQKENEITLLTIVFKSKQKIEQFSNCLTSINETSTKELFQNVDIHSFEWLSSFFKLKIQVNLKENPHILGYKLQRTLFELRHQNISARLLSDIVKLSKQVQNSVVFKEKIMMSEIEHLISQKHFKKKQQIHSFELVNISKKVQLFYHAFFQTIEIMPLFWYKFKYNALNDDDLFQLLNKQIAKEERMKKYIEELIVYKNTKVEVKLYDYAMKLLNFDYEPKMMRKGEIEFGNSELASSHYIYLSGNTISDISNRVLIELKQKKQDLIGQNFQALIPCELKQYLQSKLENALLTVKDPPEFIMPFMQMKQLLVAYKIKIDIKFNLNMGMKYIIHFLKSQDIQESPTFLYCLDSDQIVNHCHMFKQYLKNHKRKMDLNLLGSQIFGVDINHEINENCKTINDKIFCVLKRQKGNQQTKPIVLIIKNIYESGTNKYALIQLEKKNVDLSSRTDNIENLVCAIEEEKSGQAKIFREQIKNQTFFCKIANPYQSLLNQKMNKLNINCRKSNLKYILLTLLIFFFMFCGAVIFINQEVDGMVKYYQTLINQSYEATTEKQKIYMLPFILYQYFQIKNFPSSLLAIQNYNISQLIDIYYLKVNNQISLLSNYPFQNLVQSDSTYNLIYVNYQKKMQTSSTSIIDFMTIAKKSLVTNNANFVIRNENALDVIVASYKDISMATFSNYMDNVQKILIGFLAAFVFLTICIKLLAIKTRLLAVQFFNIYSKLSLKEVQSCIQKYEQLLVAGKYELYSDKKINNKKNAIEFHSNLSLTNIGNHRSKDMKQGLEEIDKISTTELKAEQIVKTEMKIKTTSQFKLFLKFSYILLLPLVCYFYFLIYMTDIQTYYDSSSLVLQKNMNLKNAIISIVKNAQKFYQASILQQVLVKPPQPLKFQSSKNVLINVDIRLPTEFDNYIQHQKNILNFDLCANLVPTSDLLFANISCYDILDGVMSRGLTQTYILYTDMIDSYGGTLMSQFINIYRPNATYPVFMQVIYVRQALCNILINLQSQYNSTIYSYIKNQNEKISGDLIKGLMVVPLLFVFMGLIMYLLHRESKAVIKCFKVLPKSFLVNIRTTKFLKNEEMLDKLQMIPL